MTTQVAAAEKGQLCNECRFYRGFRSGSELLATWTNRTFFGEDTLPGLGMIAPSALPAMVDAKSLPIRPLIVTAVEARSSPSTHGSGHGPALADLAPMMRT